MHICIYTETVHEVCIVLYSQLRIGLYCHSIVSVLGRTIVLLSRAVSVLFLNFVAAAVRVITRSLAIVKRPRDCCVILKSGSYTLHCIKTWYPGNWEGTKALYSEARSRRASIQTLSHCQRLELLDLPSLELQRLHIDLLQNCCRHSWRETWRLFCLLHLVCNAIDGTHTKYTNLHVVTIMFCQSTFLCQPCY